MVSELLGGYYTGMLIYFFGLMICRALGDEVSHQRLLWCLLWPVAVYFWMVEEMPANKRTTPE